MKNKHFVAFRTWADSCPLWAIPARILSAGRLLACAVGWNLPAAQPCSPAPPAASGGRSPRRWPRAAPSSCSAPASAEALEELAAELPGDGPPGPARRPRRARRRREARRRGRRGRHPRRQRRAARRGLAHRLQRRGGDARPARQPRGADADGPGALPGDGRARLRPPRLHLLALGQGGRARAPRSTTRPSSACAASRSACAPTSARRGSASRSSRPASSATRGCSPTPAPSRRRAWAPARPSRSAPPSCEAIERDKVEVDGRAAAAAGRWPTSRLASPGIADRAQSGSAGQKAAKAVADGHPPDKR